MEAILNNPYRVLGLSPISTDKEIAKRVSDLMIFAEMKKDVSYETDLPFLGKVDRGIENIKESIKKIEHPEQKLFYSLLWFNIKDNIEGKSIELLKAGKINESIELLKEAIFNSCPINYRPDRTLINIKKSNFKKTTNDLYSIEPYSKPAINPLTSALQGIEYIIKTKNNDGLINIQEGFTKLDLREIYQIDCRFKWIHTQISHESYICLGFIDILDFKHYISISNNGSIRFIKSNNIEFESKIDKSLLNEHNNLVVKNLGNKLEISINNKLLCSFKSEVSFQSSFFSLIGLQTVLIENLGISNLLERRSLSLDVELNEKTLSYSKNLLSIYLIAVTKTNKFDNFYYYACEILGNFYNQGYFKNYVDEMFPYNYEVNFSKLTNIIVYEFYRSFKHLINTNDEYSELGFYSPLRFLSDDAEKIGKNIILSPKTYSFESYIKEITLQRKSFPLESLVLAHKLIQESIDFFKWYGNFYGWGALSYKQIADKVGLELLECAITYFNSNTNKDISLTKQSLTIIENASNYAFNQALRDRINKNILILTKNGSITDFKPIDFDLKDKENFLESITYRGPYKGMESNNQKSNNLEPNLTNKTNRHKTKKVKKDKIILFLLISLIFIAIIVLILKPNLKNVNEVTEIKKERILIPTTNKQSSISKWKGNKKENGYSPYDTYFGKGVYDYNSECWLLFKNGNQSDAIVCLENVSTGRTIRNDYIQSGTNFKMTNLPTGIYRVKVIYGNDWNPEKTLKNGLLKGAFDTDLSFSISDNNKDWIHIDIVETDEGISYTTGEITLYTISNGNMQQRKINSNEFFK